MFVASQAGHELSQGEQSRPWDPASRVQLGGLVSYQQPVFQLPDLEHMQVKVWNAVAGVLTHVEDQAVGGWRQQQW